VDVTAIARELVQECRVAAPDREAITTVADGLHCTADPRLFRFVLGNLISNAWKYAGKQPVTRIEIGRSERDGAPMLFVRDNGIGFDPADAARLFAPFERLRNAKGFPGTGIGLAIVHKIVERHGGRVEADSRPGEGATFYVALPGCTWA
jgi:signal transduction histidine kinase